MARWAEQLMQYALPISPHFLSVLFYLSRSICMRCIVYKRSRITNHDALHNIYNSIPIASTNRTRTTYTSTRCMYAHFIGDSEALLPLSICLSTCYVALCACAVLAQSLAMARNMSTALHHTLQCNFRRAAPSVPLFD